MGPDRRYDVAALFCELDGRTFNHYDELIDEVLRLLNAHLGEFAVGYSYRHAIALAERRGWLATSDSGRSVTIVCEATAETKLSALAA